MGVARHGDAHHLHRRVYINELLSRLLQNLIVDVRPKAIGDVWAQAHRSLAHRQAELEGEFEEILKYVWVSQLLFHVYKGLFQFV